MRTLLLGSVLFICAWAAQADTSYDWQSGNTTITTPSYNGGVNVQGFNSRTGANWQTRIENNGNQSGFDSKGNYWNYNESTGSYWNSNGKTCYGKGAARVCN
jgi:hypothetical protein